MLERSNPTRCCSLQVRCVRTRPSRWCGLQKHRCEVFVLPRLHEVTQVNDDMDFLGDLPLMRLRRSAYRSMSWQLKRGIDIVFSALALVVLSPVLAACAAAVRLEGGPGVLFRQERIGRDGVRFQLLKFRSMRPANEQESKTQWNIATDNRVGPVGRLPPDRLAGRTAPAVQLLRWA